MPAYTITATCAGETATTVVTIPDLTGTLTVTQVEYLDVSAAISGLSDDATVTVDWGDGTTPESVTLSGGAGTATHTYADATGSPYTVTATGDTTGAVLTGTVTVTDPPDPALDVDYSGDPDVTATVTNVPSGATVTIDWGDDSTQETPTVTDGTATATHTYAANGKYTVRADVDDAVIGKDAYVRAAADGLTVTADISGDPNVEIDVTGVDATDDSVTIDWGDASEPTTEPILADGEANSVAYTYTANGDYTITVTGATSAQTATAAVTVAGAAA